MHRNVSGVCIAACLGALLLAGCPRHHTGNAQDARPPDGTADASTLDDGGEPDAAVPCTTPAQCDDHNACTDDLCAAGFCENPPRTDGTTCDDGLRCTLGDQCTGGRCAGATRDCTEVADACHDGACNEADGSCEAILKADGTACDDGLFCTVGETCAAGVCDGGTTRDCTSLSDECRDFVCDEDVDQCVGLPKTNGTVCDDGLFCTVYETCTDGVCGGGGAYDCSSFADQCNNGLCVEASQGCVTQPKTDGTACDDGVFCTVGEECTSGICGGGATRDCSGSGSQCTDGVCDPTLDQCVGPPKPDGTPCSNQLFCTLDETCAGGVCGGGTPRDCTASGDQCNDGMCNDANDVCAPQPKLDGTTCNDGNACTLTDGCLSGVCTGTSPITCTAQDQCHNAGTCNPATGICSNPAKIDGAACNDGSACTQTDTCQTGICTGANPVVCTASDQCHDVGTCNPATGVCSNPAKANGATCNDGNACTQTDTCQTGICTGANPVVCTASDQCHDVGTCNQATGVCSNPAKANGATCNDGNACTQTDTCQTGVCTGANPVVCTASDQCHDAGTCNTSTGLCSNPARADGTPCDDGLFCKINETCNGGLCVGVDNLCNDNDPTTTDTCDEAGNQCIHGPATTVNPGSLVSTTSDLPDPLDLCLTAGSQARVVIYTQLRTMGGSPVTGDTVIIEGSPAGSWVEPAAVESPNEPGTYYRTLVASASAGSTTVTITADGGAVTLSTLVQVAYAPANGHVTGGTGGCAPIDGNLRVKAVEAGTGVAIPNAFVMVGSAQSLTEFERSFEGLLGGASVPGANTCITDAQGYCELYDYGSNLSGPLMVTAGSTGRAYFTIVEAGASDLILPLTERHPATDIKRWTNENTNSGNQSALTALDWIYAGLALPTLELEFFSQGEVGRLMEKDRCAVLDGDPYLLPENFYIPRYYSFLIGEVIARVLWNLSLDANRFSPENISFPYGRMPTSVVQGGDWTAMLASYDYQRLGFLLNQPVVDNNAGKNVLLADDYPSDLTITVTAALPAQTDLLAFGGGDYDADLGAGRLFYLSHSISRYGPTQPMVLLLPNSDLNAAGSPTGITRLASLGARFLDEVGRTPPLTAQERWACTSALLRDDGAGGAPYGATGGTWTVSTLLDHALPSFAEPGTFTWTDAAANGISPHYSVSTLYLETRTYERNDCERIGYPAMTTRSARTARSTQWVVVKPYGLNCSGQECFQLPSLPAGWPEAGAASHKRDGFERRVGSGAACSSTPQCNTALGETCVDVDQGGPLVQTVCAIVTGTAPATTNAIQRYQWFVRSYRLSASAAFDFDDYAFADLVLYLSRQSTNEWTFDN